MTLIYDLVRQANKLTRSSDYKTASMREVQRNYRQFFDWVEASNRPLNDNPIF